MYGFAEKLRGCGQGHVISISFQRKIYTRTCDKPMFVCEKSSISSRNVFLRVGFRGKMLIIRLDFITGNFPLKPLKNSGC